MSELKPCPFCGGKPFARRTSGDERDGYAEHVSYVCSGCGCARGACGDSAKGGYADNSTVEDRARGCWNARVPSLGPGIAEIKDEIVVIRHVVKMVEAERDQFKAENEALRKDAERYRFLRRTDCWGDLDAGYDSRKLGPDIKGRLWIVGARDEVENQDGEMLDRSIDYFMHQEAMK